MLTAVFEMLYEASLTPRSAPMLPSVLVMFTIVFFVLFSTRGTKTCETKAVPPTLIAKVCISFSMSAVNAVSVSTTYRMEATTKLSDLSVQNSRTTYHTDVVDEIVNSRALQPVGRPRLRPLEQSHDQSPQVGFEERVACPWPSD